MTTLYVDNIAPNLQSRVSVPGHVIQVVQAVKTDVQSFTSVTYTDVTGLSASITPSSTSNKILVLMHMHHGSDTGIGGFRLVRGATPIHVGDASGSCTQATGGLGYGVSADNNSAYYAGLVSAVQYLDSPSTTSSTTYKVQIMDANGGNTYVNRAGYDSNNSASMRGTSSITLMEIAG
jgi:hypothetical protein